MSRFLLLYSKKSKKKFNPNFDGNALAWYNGNVGLSVGGWLDQGTGSHDLTLFNNPTIVPNAINGQQAVLFDGINQYGSVGTPVITQPYTMYFVFKTVTWAFDTFIDDGSWIINKRGYQVGVSPELSFRAGNIVAINNNIPVINTYDILTLNVDGVASGYRWNNNAETGVNFGALNGEGITIGARTGGGKSSNSEFAYIILRTGSDSTAKQDRIINSLKAHFAL